MPEYRITYQTTVSVSLTLDLPDDEAALTEEQSQGIAEKYLQANVPGFGAYDLTADATVDGMAPTRIERIDGQDYVQIGGEA